MTGMRCAVAECKNDINNVKKTNKVISFYRFPKNEHLRRVWIQRCNRTALLNWKTGRICSEHFKDEDFERDLRSELLYHSVKKKLKPNALPSMRLSQETANLEPVDKQNTKLVRTQRRPQRPIVASKQDVKKNEINNQEASKSECPSANTHLDKPTSTISVDEASYLELIEKVSSLTKTNEELQRNINFHKKIAEDNQQKVKQISKDLLLLQRKYTLEVTHRRNMERSLKHLLSKAQLGVLMGRKKKVSWTAEDVTKALTIRSISKKCYVYLRSYLKYPLPALTSLQRWTLHFRSHSKSVLKNTHS